MPAKKQITKDAIIKAAIDIVREYGTDAVNARSLAKKLKCSTQPIYLSFKGMDELKQELIKSAEKAYDKYIEQEIKNALYPPYKCYGMGYIRFAKEEKELFKLLFMRDRSAEKIRTESEEKQNISGIIENISKNLGISKDDAYIFYIEIWTCVHGIATMLATSYLALDFEAISKIITDIYQGLKIKYTKGDK